MATKPDCLTSWTEAVVGLQIMKYSDLCSRRRDRSDDERLCPFDGGWEEKCFMVRFAPQALEGQKRRKDLSMASGGTKPTN